MYIDYLDLTQPLQWTVDRALSRARCDAYIAQMTRQAQERAPIVGHDGEPVVELSTRNNTRVQWDDQAEADALLDTVRASVPAVLGGCALVCANPRLRLYRYGVGERHAAHWDTVVELVEGLHSMLTLVFYLNDDFDGGETHFVELKQSIVPQAGRALLFQHRILHEACEVTRGAKYVLRTDVLYRNA
ncbi:MAG: 2OG-Fe(II) oxygenase [Deltaproteobacteria bacterium]|nr:2OG-Fe(II) oxygenase [Deltaproteobacteria bacterium]